MMIIFKVVGPRSLQFNTLDGRTFNLMKDGHPKYDEIAQILIESEGDVTVDEKEELEARAIELADVPAIVVQYSNGELTIVNGVVYYNNFPLHNALTKRLLQFMEEGHNIEPMVRFLKNLMNNPSNAAVNELYAFMEGNDMPISVDGCLLAYKFVKKDVIFDENGNEVSGQYDYYDCHTGTTFRNRPGDAVEMPRNMVDDNRNRTCSQGLHFCSYNYAKNAWGGRLVIVKCNPADVVSIPTDYNNQKARCCKYTVVAEVDWSKGDFFQNAVYTDEGVKCAWADGIHTVVRANNVAPAYNPVEAEDYNDGTF